MERSKRVWLGFDVSRLVCHNTKALSNRKFHWSFFFFGQSMTMEINIREW